jgi:hypothetical protein
VIDIVDGIVKNARKPLVSKGTSETIIEGNYGERRAFGMMLADAVSEWMKMGILWN